MNSKLKILNKYKIPTNTKNHIGIEIECFVKSEKELKEKLIKNDLHKYVNLTYDESLYTNRVWSTKDGLIYAYEPVEIRICVEEKNLEKIIKLVSSVLKECGAFTNSTCGLHVHIDVRFREAKKMFKRLLLVEKPLLSLCNKSRQNNRFASQWKNINDVVKNLDYFLIMQNHNKYKTINFNSFFDKKTIEVRMYQGTVNANQIITWCKLLLGIIRRKEASKAINSYKYFYKKYKSYSRLIKRARSYAFNAVA